MSAEPAPARQALSWPGVLALCVFAVTLWAQGDVMVGVFYDDGIYVTAAKALAEGLGYRNIHLVGAPPVVHYPALYPLVLSVLWRLWPSFPSNVALFALGDAAALALAAWVSAGHLPPRLPQPRWVTLAALAVGFTSFPLLALLGVRLSEPLFLVCVAAAVAVADRDMVRAADGALAGALAGLAVEVKSLGVPVLAGVVLALWLRDRKRAAGLAAATGALVAAPWALWVALHAGHVDPRLANYTTYLSELRQAGLGAVLDGLKGRALWPIAGILVPPWRSWFGYPVSTLVLVAFGWGLVRAARQAPALITTLVLYFVVISLWPFPPYRFVWIVFPWVLALIVLGCFAAWKRAAWLRAGVVIVATFTAVGYVPREALSLRQRRFLINNEGITRSFRVLTTAIGAELPLDAIMAAEDEALIYLYTGRRTVPSDMFRWSGFGTEPLPTPEIVRFWCERGVTHLTVTAPGDHAANVAQELMARHDSVLTRMFQVTGGPGLYRFRCPG